MSLFGLYLRRNLDETEAFRKAAATKRTSLTRELLKHPKEILLVFGLTMGGTTAFYTYTTYMPTFLVNTVKLTRDQATQISFITLIIYAALQPVFGAISDKIGRRPVLWFGTLNCALADHMGTRLSDRDGPDHGGSGGVGIRRSTPW